MSDKFRVKIEQVDLINSLRKIKSTTGNGKDVVKIYDKYIYLEGYAEQGKKDRFLRLVTTDYTDSSDIMIPCMEATDGECPLVVEFEKFYKLITTIPQDKIITLEDKGNDVLISYDGLKNPMPLLGLSSDNFPIPIQDENAKCTTFLFSALKHGIESINNVIHQTDNQLYNCIKIKSSKKFIILTALDATYRRTVMYVSNEKGTEEAEFFLEGKRLKSIINSFDATKKIAVYITDNNVTFSQNDLDIQMRLINGTFPDCQSFFSKQYSTDVIVNRSDLINALIRLDTLTDDVLKNKVSILNIDKEGVNLSINNGMHTQYIYSELKGKKYLI